VGQYINSNTKIKILHNVESCGKTWDIVPFALLRGNGCCHCKGKKIAKSSAKTQEQFENEVFNLIGNEYQVIGKYINTNTKIKFKHNIESCNNVFEMIPDAFLRGSRCPECKKILLSNIKLKTHEQFCKEVYDLTGNEYEVISQYKGSKENITLLHNICGYNWETSPDCFLKGCRCPNCAGNAKKTTDIFKQQVYELVNNEYEVLSEYKHAHYKVLMRHNKCNHEWKVTPNSFIRGTRCPKCNLSKGEERIKQYFDKNNIIYDIQYKITDCRNKKPLPFDLAVFYDIEKTKLKCLIEYDGEFHYKQARYSKNKEKMLKKLKSQQKNDKIKNDYCNKNNIKIIRIPYWEFESIEEILNRDLNKNNFYKGSDLINA
jgi:Zn ribbon nucleic-acid-binding protein